jgi:hypothetical protein
VRSEHSASFTLTGFTCLPDEVTRALGITPSKTWTRGDAISHKATIRYKQNGWRLDSPLDKQVPLLHHVQHLIGELRGNWQTVRLFSNQHEAEFSCVVRIYDGARPEVSFDSSTIESIAELSADLDIDLYTFDAEKSTADDTTT